MVIIIPRFYLLVLLNLCVVQFDTYKGIRSDRNSKLRGPDFLTLGLGAKPIALTK